jgi:hypothetical protein
MTTPKIAIPTVLAVLAILFVMKAVGIGPAVAEAAATPYSADHARISGNPGAPEEPAPTF